MANRLIETLTIDCPGKDEWTPDEKQSAFKYARKFSVDVTYIYAKDRKTRMSMTGRMEDIERLLEDTRHFDDWNAEKEI